MKQAPKNLSEEAKSWWDKLIAEYSIDDPAGLLILQTCLEAFDRMRQSQQILARDGTVIQDRFGQRKPHPLTTVERDSRSQMLAALKSLNLDLEPIKAIGRPPAGGR